MRDCVRRVGIGRMGEVLRLFDNIVCDTFFCVEGRLVVRLVRGGIRCIGFGRLGEVLDISFCGNVLEGKPLTGFRLILGFAMGEDLNDASRVGVRLKRLFRGTGARLRRPVCDTVRVAFMRWMGLDECFDRFAVKNSSNVNLSGDFRLGEACAGLVFGLFRNGTLCRCGEYIGKKEEGKKTSGFKIKKKKKDKTRFFSKSLPFLWLIIQRVV